MLAPLLATADQGAPTAVPEFEQVCFGDFDDRQEYPTPAELKKLLAEVPGAPYAISETTRRLGTGDRRISRISGMFRLDAPWGADTTLRLSLIDPQLFQLHFWRGECGVTLRYCPAAVKTWGAYRTTRQGEAPYPTTFGVCALDCGRYRRAGLGTFEVRYHDGNLVLTRGDLRLLSVPLEGLPSEVYLQGSAMVRGISIYRSTGGPKDPYRNSFPCSEGDSPIFAPRKSGQSPSNLLTSPKPPEPSPTVLRVARPADADWKTALSEKVTLGKLPDGAVELEAAGNAPAAHAGLHVPGPGLYQYIFELEAPDVGTGVFLGDREGRQLARLAFYRDKATSRTAFAYLAPYREATELEFHFEKEMVPYAGEHQWIRLTLGGGVMKCWTSGDGVHWSQAIWSPLPVQGAVEQAGLYCIRMEQPRSIRLRSLEVRRLDTLSSLVPEAIQRRVGPLGDCTTVEAWQARVVELRPADVPPEVWRRACILRTLAENPPFSLGGKLIHLLLDDVLAEEGNLAWQRKLLDEAAILTHCLDAQGAQPFDRHYERLGIRLLRAGHPDPTGVVAAAVMRTPIWNFDHQDPWPEKLFRQALLTRAAEDRWPEVARLLDAAQFWLAPETLENRHPPWSEELRYLIDWAEFQLDRRPEGPASDERSPGPPSWRSPLIERLSKEAYNVVAEFRSALDAGAHREACQIISSSADPSISGLLPDRDDHRLLLSAPAAVELAMQETPALQQTMQEHFAVLAELRWNQAVAAADPVAAEAVALQFCGTSVAANAHAWLGDRQLSAGRIAQAAGHYRRALQSAGAQQRDSLQTRLRLAGAMRGRDVGRPTNATVRFGDMELSAAEFEGMVRQIREANGGDATGNGQHTSGDSGAEPEPASLPERYETRPLARVDGNGIRRPPHMPERGFDWAARQIAAVVSGGQMIVNNQLELAAFDLATGKRQWSHRQQVSGERAKWPALWMRPVATDTRLFTRRLTDHGPELACFERREGSLIWHNRPPDYVASDPLLIGQGLFALTVARDQGRKLSLRLAEFDPATGRLRRAMLLAEFDDRWEGRLLWRATEAGGKLVATAAGCVVCCDLLGRVCWIRQQIWIPAPSHDYSKAARWLRRRHESPLAADGRIYVTQPGVWNIECLDLQTGRLIWREAVSELTALLGRVEQRLIVETAEGFLAKDVGAGKTVWYHDAADRLDGWLCGPGAGIVYSRTADAEDASKGRDIILVYLDPASGEVRGTSILDASTHKEPAFGPFVAHGSRKWGFLAVPGHPATREVLELIPVE